MPYFIYLFLRYRTIYSHSSPRSLPILLVKVMHLVLPQLFLITRVCHNIILCEPYSILFICTFITHSLFSHQSQPYPSPSLFYSLMYRPTFARLHHFNIVLTLISFPFSYFIYILLGHSVLHYYLLKCLPPCPRHQWIFQLGTYWIVGEPHRGIFHTFSCKYHYYILLFIVHYCKKVVTYLLLYDFCDCFSSFRFKLKKI